MNYYDLVAEFLLRFIIIHISIGLIFFWFGLIFNRGKYQPVKRSIKESIEYSTFMIPLTIILSFAISVSLCA